jgi:hypothetical protein
MAGVYGKLYFSRVQCSRVHTCDRAQRSALGNWHLAPGTSKINPTRRFSLSLCVLGGEEGGRP